MSFSTPTSTRFGNKSDRQQVAASTTPRLKRETIVLDDEDQDEPSLIPPSSPGAQISAQLSRNDVAGMRMVGLISSDGQEVLLTSDDVQVVVWTFVRNVLGDAVTWTVSTLHRLCCLMLFIFTLTAQLYVGWLIVSWLVPAQMATAIDLVLQASQWTLQAPLDLGILDWFDEIASKNSTQGMPAAVNTTASTMYFAFSSLTWPEL